MVKKINFDLRLFCELKKSKEDIEEFFKESAKRFVYDLPFEENQMVQYTIKKHYLDAEEVFKNYLFWPVQDYSMNYSKDFNFTYKGYTFDGKIFDTKELLIDYIRNELKPYEYIVEYHTYKIDEEK